jgi:hypothetical protein
VLSAYVRYLRDRADEIEVVAEGADEHVEP